MNPRAERCADNGSEQVPSINLTAQFIKGIRPPTSGRIEYWDIHTPGLCLRVAASGAGSWTFRYRPRNGGKQNERVTFGSWTVLSLADARDRAARVRGEVVDGGNPQATRRQQREAAKGSLDVRFGSLADMAALFGDVCFTPESRHKAVERPDGVSQSSVSS